jgi:hypothetical protein
MAIEPKSPRKRVAKKSSKKSLAPTAENTEVSSVSEAVATEEAAPKSRKKAAVPVPVFQAPTPDKAPAKTRKSSAKAAKEEPSEEASVASEDSDNGSDSESRSSRNRRRRRGGRGRRKPNGVEGEDSQNDSEDSDSEESTEDSTDADGTTHRRRRRRRASGDGATAGEVIDEDGVVTVVKVREAREKTERPLRERSTRERSSRNSRGRDRDRNDSYREPYRRRGTILTDADFLARRENVDREMVVRQVGDRIQIAVIEDNVMVEHYVNRNANVSYVGNVYLGRVQNVLPSMEAAFVDIGKGRNAVLYAGEVNWDAAGISESEPRKIEMVLKTG